MLFILRLILFLALAHFAVRFIRGIMSGLGASRLRTTRGAGARKIGIDASDIIDAEYKDVDDPEGRERHGR